MSRSTIARARRPKPWAFFDFGAIRRAAGAPPEGGHGVTLEMKAVEPGPITPLPEGASRDRSLPGKARRRARKARNAAAARGEW